MANYYEVLGIGKDADAQTIKSAYKKLAKKYHPDINPSQGDKFKDINDAYQTLKSPIKRAKYILSLHKSVEKITLPPDFLMQQMEWEERLEAIEKNNSELAQFKLTINKKYEEYSLLLSSQIDDDQNWSDAAITIDKLYFVEKLLEKINNALN